MELKSLTTPPIGCRAILEGIRILLNPSQHVWDWPDGRKLMSGSRDDFLQRIFTIDKDNINDEQLEKLKSILAQDDCQPAQLAKLSRLCSKLRLWLQAVVEYATERQKK